MLFRRPRHRCVAQPFALAVLRLVLIVAGASLALVLTSSAVFTFLAVAVGIGSFAAGLLIVTWSRFDRPTRSPS